MTLRVYNTLSRTVEDFKPIKEGEVKAYVCGMTVYDLMHIGHARTYVAFDAVLRYLRYRGYRVKYVQNITDVDDKIIKRARERGREPLELSREFAEKSLEDQKSLQLLPAGAYPKVSEHIPDIIKDVETLVKKGCAYDAGGSVYFDVSTFGDYGKLSKQNTEQLNEHRIEPDPRKKTPLDFSLWKKSDEGELGFESPWGRGRPGWHIECSVMSKKYLGEQFDIHGGALDLVFPHHENEIAQSESLSGKKPFVGYWMHTGFLQSTGEKMSKSLGNIIPVREFLKDHDPQAFRLFVLSTHYRSPVDYSRENMEAAENALNRLKTFRKELDFSIEKASGNKTRAGEAADELKKRFVEFMDDDFNTPKAFGAVFDAVRKINAVMNEGGDSKESLAKAAAVFDEVLGAVGLGITPEEEKLSKEDEELVKQREKLRAEKKWAEADKIRDTLLKRGIKLIDKNDGTTKTEKIQS